MDDYFHFPQIINVQTCKMIQKMISLIISNEIMSQTLDSYRNCSILLHKYIKTGNVTDVFTN